MSLEDEKHIYQGLIFSEAKEMDNLAQASMPQVKGCDRDSAFQLSTNCQICSVIRLSMPNTEAMSPSAKSAQPYPNWTHPSQILPLGRSARTLAKMLKCVDFACTTSQNIQLFSRFCNAFLECSRNVTCGYKGLQQKEPENECSGR